MLDPDLIDLHLDLHFTAASKILLAITYTWQTHSHQRSMKSNLQVRQYHLQVKTELEALKEVLQWFETLVFPLVPQKI